MRTTGTGNDNARVGKWVGFYNSAEEAVRGGLHKWSDGAWRSAVLSRLVQEWPRSECTEGSGWTHGSELDCGGL